MVGLAISAMHYTGMAGYHVAGIVEWDSIYVTASVLMAVVVGALAVRQWIHERNMRTRHIGTALLVLAIDREAQLCMDGCRFAVCSHCKLLCRAGKLANAYRSWWRVWRYDAALSRTVSGGIPARCHCIWHRAGACISCIVALPVCERDCWSPCGAGRRISCTRCNG